MRKPKKIPVVCPKCSKINYYTWTGLKYKELLSCDCCGHKYKNPAIE